jgi:hypothetical protein
MCELEGFDVICRRFGTADLSARHLTATHTTRRFRIRGFEAHVANLPRRVTVD